MIIKKTKDSKDMDKRTSKPAIIHEDEIEKHHSKGVITGNDETV